MNKTRTKIYFILFLAFSLFLILPDAFAWLNMHVDPVYVPADGTSKTTVTVTVLNPYPFPAPPTPVMGDTITFAILSGGGCTITPSAQTDENGEAIAIFKAGKTVERVKIIATDTSREPQMSIYWFMNVLGVESVTWEAINSPLMTCPNNGGKRIFPDNTGDNANRRIVRVKAKITPIDGVLLSGIRIYFKSFDIDDPSSDTSPLDENGKKGNDNKGKDPSPEGKLANEGLAYTDTNGIAQLEFTVTMQPGDNFKVAASVYTLPIDGVKQPQYLDTLTVDGVDVKGPNNAALLPCAKVTEMLTVWRKLHVEVDSMGAVPTTGPEKNFISGDIIRIDKKGSIASEVVVKADLSDGSNDLGPPEKGNGRFENGTLKVNGVTIGEKIDGNGVKFIRKNSGFDIPFTITKGAASESGEIIQMQGRSFKPKANITIKGPDYKGGTLNVCGKTFTVFSAAGGSIIVTQDATLPFEVRDDDVITGDVPMPNFSDLARVLKPAYVEPVFDVGNNNTNVNFKLNLQTGSDRYGALDWDSKRLNSNDFWVGYLLGVYQHDTINDLDPDAEGGVAGSTFRDLGGCLIYEEPHREYANPSSEEQNTVAHEISHLYGSRDVSGQPMIGNSYTPETINFIREAPKPAG